MPGFFATAPKGVEPLLAQELTGLGATAVEPGRGGVSFSGRLATAYRACLWSRTAMRILVPLATFTVADAKDLYRGAAAIPWEDHLTPKETLLVDCHTVAAALSHSQYAAQTLKDAIVDRCRAQFGERPSVARSDPDIRIHCYLHREQAVISLDLAGAMHRRGYRADTVIAPLKENLAAALLLKTDWPAVAAAGGALLDPLCGSGTLPIEAALMAADIAPGLLRPRWGFERWRQHEPAPWAELLDEARQRRDQGLTRVPPIAGYDHDARAVRTALVNAGRAGVQRILHFEQRELTEAAPLTGATTGLLIANPPYGERLQQGSSLERLYENLGDVLKTRFSGWQAAVFTGNPELGKRMGLKTNKINAFYNGPLPCKLLQFSVEPAYFVDRDGRDARAREILLAAAEPFANRLGKNLQRLSRWARRAGVTCYRLYDADMPEYAVAVDRYENWAHVQEYAAPATVDPAKAAARLEQVMAVLPTVLNIPADNIFLKSRRRQAGSNQYEKLATTGRFHEVHEGPCRFLVNFSDYLDTGLFLDQRLTRQWLGELARNRRFLNLFGYTGTASVYAALGGARSTVTVDLSATYLDWAQRNLRLNGIKGPSHALVQADCLRWLEAARERFELIFLDPPTFSNSKRMQTTFDVQRDHVDLIRRTARLLDTGGILIFSNNFRRFELDTDALAEFRIEDVSRRTLPKDFARNPKIHHCWRIERSG